MEKNYVEENEKILDAWKQEYKNRGKDICFSGDGIIFRGEFAKNDNGNWYRKESGRENELWAKCPLRILYLTKDQSAGENHDQNWDCRVGSLHHPNSDIADYKLFKVSSGFNQNLANSLYGLATTTLDKYVEFEDLDEKEVVKVSDEYPFAQINCKKEAGGSNCDMSVLKKAMEEFHSFLKQQILNLDADIFVCCGEQKGENPSLNFLNEIGYKFEFTNDKDSYDIYYDVEKNKIAIGSYHLGYYAKGRKEIYDDIVKTYYYFLQKHPDFIKSHRK